MLFINTLYHCSTEYYKVQCHIHSQGACYTSQCATQKPISCKVNIRDFTSIAALPVFFICDSSIFQTSSFLTLTKSPPGERMWYAKKGCWQLFEHTLSISFTPDWSIVSALRTLFLVSDLFFCGFLSDFMLLHSLSKHHIFFETLIFSVFIGLKHLGPKNLGNNWPLKNLGLFTNGGHSIQDQLIYGDH